MQNCQVLRMFFFFRHSQLFCGTGHFIPQCLAKFYAKLQGADNLFCFPGLRDMYRKEMQQQLDMHTTQMEKWKDIERWDHLLFKESVSRAFQLAVSFIKSKSKKIGNTGCCIRFRFRRSIRDLLKKFDIKCRTKYLPGFACSSEV